MKVILFALLASPWLGAIWAVVGLIESHSLLLLPIVRCVELIGMQHRVLGVVLLDVVQDISRRIVNGLLSCRPISDEMVSCG